jgi:hypothetical protein
VWRWGVPAARDPFSPTLLDLPDAAAAVLVVFLDANSLRAVALCCRDALPPLAHAFRRRFVLRLPPDSPRNEVFMRAIRHHGNLSSPTEGHQDDTMVVPLTAHSHDAHDFAAAGTEGEPTITQVPSPPTMGLLATQFAVADTGQAADLLPLGPHVRGLVISSNEYTAWPERPFRWDVLGKFTALERLEIDDAWERPLDLTLLSLSMPQLEVLAIKVAWTVTGRLTDLPRLRVLHLEDTNIDSFAIAVGLPNLQSLTLIASRYQRPGLHRLGLCSARAPLANASCLADVVPLTRFVVSGTLQESPRPAMQPHYATLREFVEIDYELWLWGHYSKWLPDLRTMVHLRSLRLGRLQQMDMEPLSVLVMLEQLQVLVAETCEHCVPLRRLTRLRELEITNGWVGDLVGYLPRLEKLVWDDTFQSSYPQRKLRRRDKFNRDEDHIEASSLAHVSRLRQLVLCGHLLIDINSPGVYEMLENVEQVEVFGNRLAILLLQSLAGLRHVKRLSIFEGDLTPWQPAYANRHTWAFAESLEELFYWSSEGGLSAPLPRWFRYRLPNLRVLGSPFEESMAALGELCPRLTHLHAPFSTNCLFSATNRTSLSRLCVVSLSIGHDCEWLRRERGPGRALPSLQRIFHPTTDCLSSAHGCQRHLTFRNVSPRSHNVFVGGKVLRPPWGHVCGKSSKPIVAEHFYRLSP